MECIPMLNNEFFNENLDFIIHIAFIMNSSNLNLYNTYKVNEKKNYDEIKITNLLEL